MARSAALPRHATMIPCLALTLLAACGDSEPSTPASEGDGGAGLALEGVSDGVAASGPGILESDAKVDVRARLRAQEERPPRLEVELTIEEGWHVNANPASMEFLIPTEVTLHVDGRPVAIDPRYPAPTDRFATPLGEEPIAVYESGVVIHADVAADAGLEGAVPRARVRLQACNDEGRCLPPATVDTPVEATRG